MIKLSILICTTSARENIIQPLLKNLRHQMKRFQEQVELIINEHETDVVGKKRNDLLKLATGEWVVFVDSDDRVSGDYVKLILRALKANPDAVGISGVITTNGKSPHQWHISKDYKRWYKEGKTYYRTPNHISPIRKTLALKAMFPEISYGEDFEYSMRVLPLIQTECKVKGNIYSYLYNDRK